MKRVLYHPEKYRVIIGKGSDGLCTTWSDPELLIKKNGKLIERFAIIGTLYSIEGVSIILRNLALNPDIRILYLHRGSKLSNTEYGSQGWRALKEVWRGNFSQVHHEIERNTLEKIIDSVKLVDISDIPIEELHKARKGGNVPYMNPIEFPEKSHSTTEPLKSEEAGFLVRGTLLYRAWLKAIDKILRYGHIKDTEYGNKQKELHALMWVFDEKIENLSIPDLDTKVLKKIGFSGWEKYLDTYLDGSKPADIAYTYGQRLRNFHGIDQVRFIVRKLRKSPQTRRAVACLYDPPNDESMTSPPCFNWMQTLERNGKLDMFAVFRSHDMIKAAIPNAIGLMNLHKFISEEARIPRGKIVITSYSAHIYEEDWEDAVKLARCQIWERKKKVFRPEDQDPRGNAIIRILENEIEAEIEGISVRGKTAKETAYTLANLDLISNAQHWVDVGMEIQKAELCLALGIDYIQDEPLNMIIHRWQEKIKTNRQYEY